MSVAVVIAIIAGGSLALSLGALIVRGIYLLGKLVSKVENQDAKTDSLEVKVENQDAKLDALITVVSELRTEVSQLRAEVQQTNRILVGLANHTHPQDMDGRTFFTVPS